MTAGRGVIHSEMPEQADGRMEGFQLWLNLPAVHKMRDPGYRDIPANEIPEVQRPGVLVRVVAGRVGDTAGAVQREHTEPLLLDIRLEAGARFEQALPAGHNAFAVVYRGGVDMAGAAVPAMRMAILANRPAADGVALTAGPAGARVLLVAGAPLNEPIVQYGPFVMNSKEEIFQAVEDFRRGVLA
jgi:redox-sensitive bicupin YhaK (pirin superfamily)